MFPSNVRAYVTFRSHLIRIYKKLSPKKKKKKKKKERIKVTVPTLSLPKYYKMGKTEK